MHGNPDADIMRDIVQLLRERIEQGLLTIFIKIKAHRGDPSFPRKMANVFKMFAQGPVR